MSSKSDRDNRSNQLNPNNDAYYSSRGTSRGYDDDGESYSGSSSGYSAPVTRYEPVMEERPYTFVYVTMYGSVLAYDIVAQRVQHWGEDLYGIAEKCFRMISGYIAVHTGTPRVAYARGLEAGKPHMVLEFQYPSWAFWLQSESDRNLRARLDSLWSDSAQPVVDEVKRRTDAGLPIQSVSLGIVTEGMLNLREPLKAEVLNVMGPSIAPFERHTG